MAPRKLGGATKGKLFLHLLIWEKCFKIFSGTTGLEKLKFTRKLSDIMQIKASLLKS
jgi:hypothetical protein